MDNIYIKNLRVRAEHVDYKEEMKLSSFMNIFQECCIAHTEQLGMGRHMTFDKGFLWVIISEHIYISRMPKYDENIIVECYPGETLHYFLPRYINIKNEKDEVLIKAVALWSLIDKKNRQFIDPEENGIIINGINKNEDIRPAIKINVPNLEKKKYHKANYSMVDINGHLGNKYYVDMMCDEIYQNENKIDIKEITILFKKEIPINTKFLLKFDKIENDYYFKNKYFESKFSLR